MKARRKVLRAAAESLETRQLLAAPVISAIADLTDAPGGKPVIIPLHATDADNDALTYAITSSNPNIRIERHTGNPYLQMDVSYNNGTTGTIVFELFEDLAPKTVQIIRGFVESGFYNGLTFHRIANLQTASDPAFIVQGGDPQGTGSGGPGFQFEDEVSFDAMFTGSGQLAMANSGDDTNGSQFFITSAPVRHLDLIHTIFGQLVSGSSTLTALTQVDRNSSDKPTNTVSITSAKIIEDHQDSVITLWCPAGVKGDINVSVSDGTSAAFTSFHVNGVVDNHNEQPILKPMPDYISASPGHTIKLPFGGMDWENQSFSFTALLSTNDGVFGEFIGKTLYIKTVPTYSGKFTATVNITLEGDSQSVIDSEKITIGVGDKPVKNLRATNPSTGDGQASELTLATFKDSDPTGKVKNWTAEIRWGDGSTTSNATITKNASGLFSVKGTHTYKYVGSPDYTVIVTGDKGARAVVNGTVTVNDAALTATPLETLVGKPNVALSSVALATFTTADATPTMSEYSADIDWGDGSATTPGTITQSGSGSTAVFTVKGSHTYANAGEYPVKVTINSSEDSMSPGTTPATTSATATIRISRDTLVVNLTSSEAVAEGQTYIRGGSFTDSVGTSWTAKVDYGDGDGLQPLTLNNDKTFTLNHKYEDSGAYTITVIVFDENNQSGYATQSADITNVAPAMGDVKVDISNPVTGQTVTVSYSATDVSPADTKAGFTYVINWGDGTADTTISPNSSTTPTHAYTDSKAFVVTVTVKDQDLVPTSSKTVDVTVAAIHLAADPDKSSLNALYIGGTASDDNITVSPNTGDGGGVTVFIGGVNKGTFNPTGQIIIYGGAGKDNIVINSAITLNCLIYGGAGNDTITAGAGNDVIFGDAGLDSITGGAGNDIILGGTEADTLLGGDGRDILIGGSGISDKDSLDGGAGDDILIGSSTSFDSKIDKLRLIQKEWVRIDHDYAKRVGYIKGTKGGSNGTTYFNKNTIQDDFSNDILRGGAGNDLFYAGEYSSYTDTLKDKTSKEQLGIAFQ